jgi:hypothetical protein
MRPDCMYLSCTRLANEAAGLFLCGPIASETKALDMCVRRRAILAIVAFDLADLNHLVEIEPSKVEVANFNASEWKTARSGTMIVGWRVWMSEAV